MRIVTFASGSTGNCSLVSDGGVHILVDAGISMRRIVKGLETLGLAPCDIDGVLITHEHSDHVSGLKMLNRHYALKIYAPSELCRVLTESVPELKENLKEVAVNAVFNIGGLGVEAFCTPHDSVFSAGYVFGGGRLAYCTDTGCVTEEMSAHLMGADAVLIEANHDIKMLRSGPYPAYLKRRILSERGHLSNEACAFLANMLAKSGTRHIILAHLSRENNTPELARETVSQAIAGLGARLYVAPMDGILIVETEETAECRA